MGSIDSSRNGELWRKLLKDNICFFKEKYRDKFLPIFLIASVFCASTYLGNEKWEKLVVAILGEQIGLNTILSIFVISGIVLCIYGAAKGNSQNPPACVKYFAIYPLDIAFDLSCVSIAVLLPVSICLLISAGWDFAKISGMFEGVGYIILIQLFIRMTLGVFSENFVEKGQEKVMRFYFGIVGALVLLYFVCYYFF